MNKQDLIKYIISKINFSGFGDYTLETDKDDGFVYLLFKKENYINYIVIGVGPQDRSTPDKLIVGNNIPRWVSFPKVTSILKNIHSKTNQPQTIEREFLITVSSYPSLESGNTPIFINSNSDIVVDGKTVYFDVLNAKCQLIENHIYKFYLPFFNSISSLQTVNEDLIDRIPHMELSDYISGEYMTFKKQIIMKLCNNPKYEEYVAWLDNNFEKALKLNESKFLQERYYNHYKMFLELTDYLKTDFSHSEYNHIT